MARRELALAALPVWLLFLSCVCIIWVHGPARHSTEVRASLPDRAASRSVCCAEAKLHWQLDEAGALRLAEGHGYVKVHRDPTVNGHDQIIAPHGYASLHEQKVKVPLLSVACVRSSKRQSLFDTARVRACAVCHPAAGRGAMTPVRACGWHSVDAGVS